MSRLRDVACVVLALLLQGCAGPRDAEQQQAQLDAQARSALAAAPRARGLVVEHRGAWVRGAELPAAEPQARVLQRQVSYASVHGVPDLPQLRDWLQRETGIAVQIETPGPVSAPVRTGSAAAPAPAVTGTLWSYQGSLQGLLDAVAAKQQVWWRWHAGSIVFYRTRTDVLVLPRIPQGSSVDGEIVSDVGTSNAGHVGMKLTRQIDQLGALRSAAVAVAGSGASVLLDPEWGTLIVTATAPQLDRVHAWFDTVAAMLRQQVAIDLRIYSIQLSREDNYGVNISPGSGRLSIDSHGLAPGVSPISSGPMQFGASIVSGALAGSKVMLQALSGLGQVSELYSRSGVTPNGQVLGLEDTESRDYISTVTTTATAAVGSSTSVQTSTVTSGFTSTFLPRVADGRINLDISLKVADLLPFTASTVGNTSIQLKDVKSSVELASVALQPGQSLLIVGDRKQSAGSTRNGVGSPWFALLGGGVEAQRGDTVLAIVVSARLL